MKFRQRQTYAGVAGGGMSAEFSEAFQASYNSIYLSCYRRIPSEGARLTPQTLAILNHLAAIGPASVNELAKHFGRAQSTVTEIVDRLQDNGLVARVPDERDRRRVFIWLSQEGKKRLREATTPLDPALISKLAKRLDATEQATLLALFSKLTTGEKNEV